MPPLAAPALVKAGAGALAFPGATALFKIGALAFPGAPALFKAGAFAFPTAGLV